MNIEEMKKKLKSIKTITFSKHFHEPKVRLRGISEEEVKNHLRYPKKLEIVEDQGEDIKGHKYGLLFHKSNKYDLKVVVSIKNKSLNVITTYIQNKKRRKVFEKWLKRLR
ncbi:MAG: DUF4258 domain-containing protein [Methanosarcinales archaeon]